MAVTYTITYPFVPKLESVGSQRKCVSRWTLAGTYDSGGFLTTPSDFGLACPAGDMEDVQIAFHTLPGGLGSAATFARYNAGNQRIELWRTNDQAIGGGSVAGIVLQIAAHSK